MIFPILLAMLAARSFGGGDGPSGTPRSDAAQTRARHCEAKAPGKCWHIGLTGKDSNAGTAEAPFATFAKAQSVAKAGDYIYYLSGEYTNDAQHFIKFDKQLSGAAGQRITIKPYPGANVIFVYRARNGSLAYLGGEGATVEGFEFRNSRYGGAAGAINGWTQGIAIWGRFIHFRRNHVHDITGYSNGNGGSLRIQDGSDNEVYNNYFDRLSVAGTGASHNVNHVIVMAGLNNRIYNNYFAGSASGCFLQKHDPRAGNRAAVFNNTFVNCARSGVNIQGFGYTVHHNLFLNSSMNYDYTGAHNNIFEFNTVYHSAPVLVGGRGEPNTLRRNIFYQTARAFDVGNGLYTLRINHYSPDAGFRVGLAGDVFEANCYFNPNMPVRFSYYGGSPPGAGGIYTLAQFKALGKERNSVEADPRFVDARANDFRPQPGSPCAEMGAYAAPSPGNPPLTPAQALGR